MRRFAITSGAAVCLSLAVCDSVESPAVSGSLAPPTLRTSFGSGGGWRGSPIVVSIDGAPAIISSSFSRVQAYRIDGTEIWSRPTDGRNYGGTIIADLSGAGDLALVAADNTGMVHMFRLDGTPVPGWPFVDYSGREVRSLAADDLDGDGSDEIIIFSDSHDSNPNPMMYVVTGDGTMLDGWPHFRQDDPHTGRACTSCGSFDQNLAVGDLEGDGEKEIVFTQDRYSISIFHTDGTPQMANPTVFSWCDDPGVLHWGEIRTYVPYRAERTGACTPYDEIIEFTYSPPTLADLDGDGTLEVVVLGNTEMPVGNTLASALAVYRYDRTWFEGFAPYPQSGSFLGKTRDEMHPVAVVADLGPEAGLEIYAMHLDGQLTAYSSSGDRLWKLPIETGGPCLFTEPVIGDLDGDRVPEILVIASCARGQGTLVVAAPDGGELLRMALPYGTLASPTLIDLEGDGDLEMLVHAQDYQPNIYIYDWGKAPADVLIWPTGRGDFRHRGVFPP